MRKFKVGYTFILLMVFMMPPSPPSTSSSVSLLSKQYTLGVPQNCTPRSNINPTRFFGTARPKPMPR